MQSISEKMEKEAARLLEKYGHTAEKRLEKAEKQNPRNSFFTQNFVGKKISGFWVCRHFRRAKEFFDQKNLDKAEKELQLLMKWDPLFAPAWHLKAEIEYENDQFKEAIWCATCALKLEPDCLDALVLRARAELALESHASAVADLIQISERFPNRADTWMNVGVIALQYGKLDLADRYIRRGCELDPTLINKLALVNSCMARKEYEETEDLCREIEKAFWEELTAGLSAPYETLDQKKALLEKSTGLGLIEDPSQFWMSILLGLMISLDNQGKLDEACGICEEILYFCPDNVAAKTCLAETFVQKEELDRALELFNELLDANPTPTLHWHVGEVLYKMKKFEEALPHLRIAMQKRIHSESAMRYVLLSMCELGNMDELFQFCSEMIAQGKKSAELFHIRGSMNLMQGETDKALADLQKSVRLAPRNPECWIALSRAFLQKMRLKEAADAAKRTLQLQPDRLEAGLICIQALDLMGRSDEVVQMTKQLVQHLSDPLDQMLLEADMQTRLKNIGEAKVLYNKILDLNPRHAVALAGRARIWQDEENWSKAFEDITLAIQTAPKVTVFYFQRAVYAANLKNFQQAISDCEYYMAREPDDLRAVMLLGEVRMEMKQPEAAIVLFQKVLSKDPENAQALRRCAEVKMTLNLQESALNDMQRAIELSPDDDELQVIYVQILLKLKREKEALKCCSDFLDRHPESLSVHYTRGTILMKMGQPEEALADFDWVCERDRESIQPHLSRAVTLNAVFRHEEALKELDFALEIQPDYIPALSEKALTCSILGKTNLSLELLDKILEKTPEDVYLLNIRGTVLANEQRIDEATEAFMKAIEIQPDYAPSLNNLGHMQMLNGDWEKGLETLSRAIESNGKWGRPHLNRALIYMKIHSLKEAREDIDEAQRKAQEAGDEDVLVDAIELRNKLKILEKFVGPEDQEDDSEDKFWEKDGEEGEDDYDGDYDDEDEDEDDEDDEDNEDGDENDEDDDSDISMKDFLKYLYLKNRKMKMGMTEDEFDDTLDFSEVENVTDEELFGSAMDDVGNGEESGDDFGDDFGDGPDEDPDEDLDDDFDADFDVDPDDQDDVRRDGFGADHDDEDEDLRNELDENPEDFDFLVDSDDEFASLTSDFMEVEEFLSYEVPIKANVGKNLWPKFEPVGEEEADSPNGAKEANDVNESNGAAPEEEGSDPRVEMTLNYLDLSLEENSGKKDPVLPAQTQNALDFLGQVFQFWCSELTSEETENEGEKDEDDEDGENDGIIEIVPPIIINCPEVFQKSPENPQDSQGPAAPLGVNFTIQMASFYSYRKDREIFFEQLMNISEILDRALREAETPARKKLVMRHKWNFEGLMKLIMAKLLNPKNQVLMVVTNFLTNRIMNRLSGK